MFISLNIQHCLHFWKVNSAQLTVWEPAIQTSFFLFLCCMTRPPCVLLLCILAVICMLPCDQPLAWESLSFTVFILGPEWQTLLGNSGNPFRPFPHNADHVTGSVKQYTSATLKSFTGAWQCSNIFFCCLLKFDLLYFQDQSVFFSVSKRPFTSCWWWQVFVVRLFYCGWCEICAVCSLLHLLRLSVAKRSILTGTNVLYNILADFQYFCFKAGWIQSLLLLGLTMLLYYMRFHFLMFSSFEMLQGVNLNKLFPFQEMSLNLRGGGLIRMLCRMNELLNKVHISAKE